jgi:hypothetical protein
VVKIKFKGNELEWVFSFAQKYFLSPQWQEYVKKKNLQELDNELRKVMCTIHPLNINTGNAMDEWILSIDEPTLHYEEVLERFGNNVVVECPNCGRTQYLNIVDGIKNGWSLCCGKIMPIVYIKHNSFNDINIILQKLTINDLMK